MRTFGYCMSRLLAVMRDTYIHDELNLLCLLFFDG
jgi:hypothetical protein